MGTSEAPKSACFRGEGGDARAAAHRGVAHAIAIAAALLAASVFTWALQTAIAASLARIAFSAWSMPRLVTR